MLASVATRMTPDARKAAILEAALVAAKRHGLARLTRDHVADAAGVSAGLVSARLGDMDRVKQAVRDLAKRRNVELGDGHASGEWEWLRGSLSPSVRYRVMVSGEPGADEVTRLIDQLKAQRSALAATGK